MQVVQENMSSGKLARTLISQIKAPSVAEKKRASLAGASV